MEENEMKFEIELTEREAFELHTFIRRSIFEDSEKKLKKIRCVIFLTHLRPHQIAQDCTKATW